MPARRFQPVVPDPGCVRRIDGSFAWLDHRLLREGHMERLTLADLALYVFLVLAADREGVSFYRQETIGRILGLDSERFHAARERLLQRHLIAFRPHGPGRPDGCYQVLPVPCGASAGGGAA